MRPSPRKAVIALLSAVFLLSACRSANRDFAARSGRHQPDPAIAAKHLFSSHYGFYYKDPNRCRALLTPRLYHALKRHYDAFESTRQIGALDCDPWTNAQDGEISNPYTFTTLNARDSEAVVRFKYTFALGPETPLVQSVLMKFQRPAAGQGWLLSDLIMPNNESLVELLER